ncbi:MAG: hypothetical protein ACT4QF_14755 [Sporichthyaceae bacterium]
MSQVLYVLHKASVAIADWQIELDRLGFPLKLDPSLDLDDWGGGFMPVQHDGAGTGFDFSSDPAEDREDWAPQVAAVVADYPTCSSFTFAREQEGIAALVAAAALASLVDGRLYDTRDEALLTAQEAVEAARAA